MKLSGNSYKLLIGLLLLIMISPLLLAQTDEQRSRFEEERIAFFTKELQLTDAESEAFWPVYNDYSNRKMAIGEEERNLLRYFQSNKENMSEQEISESLEKFMNIWDQKHKLEIEYHNKFKEILPEKKVMQIYIAERQFRMHLVKGLRKHGQGREGGPKKGTGQGRGYKAPLPDAPLPDQY